MIQNPQRTLHGHQNLTTSFHAKPLQKTSSKSVKNYLSDLGHKRTHTQKYNVNCS